MEDYYSVEEFAEKLGVSTETVRRWLRSKKIRGMKLGRDWRIPKEEAEKGLHNN